MALSAGARLGPYEVLGPIGAGGMGEVYRARDTRLGREVAIKVLSADRLSDPIRRARFVQEARAASALNHPHIVTIHEIEKEGDTDFIVMELVPGKTLDALIPRHGMRLGEVLRVAIPLADALAAAHGAGIVHRDFKPANVMVTPEGIVKVLDFGLAKLTQAEEGGGEDATTLDARARLSRPGTVAGTPAYMSPEQAAGGAVDARSDVFSFGAVLYEMVTGRRPFGGGSSAEMLAAVLKEQPKAPSELVPEVPKELERIILRCLRKEPERRYQHMSDVRIELQDVKEESDSQASAPAGTATAKRRSRRRWILLVAGAVVVLAAGAAATLWRLRRSELPPPRLVQLGWTGREAYGSFSPDGAQIVFLSREEKGDDWHVWLKLVGETEARRLTSNPVDLGLSVPAWSPDGKQIAFARSASPAAAGGICLVSPVGGAERRLLDFPTSPSGQLSWSSDGSWLAAARSRAEGETTPESGGIHFVPVGGGDPRAVTFPKPPTYDNAPAFSPDGRALAYASCAGEGMPTCDVYVLPLDSDLRPREEARRLSRQGLWITGLAWTRDGRSIVWGGGANSQLWRVRADGSTPPQPVELAGTGARAPSSARGQDRLVFTRYRWAPAIYRIPLGGSPTPLIESTAVDMFPQYSPDGRRIAFESARTGTDEIWLAEASGSNPTRLTRGPGRYQGSPRWSPDGRSVAFDSQGQDGHWDIWAIHVDGSGLRQVTRRPTDENMPSFSRDGRWIYFGSNRTGRSEVWRVAAEGGTEEQVTREGGALPFESLDGRTLYYMRPGQNNALLARPTAGGAERVIFRCVDTTSYSVAPHGLFHVDCNPPGSRNASQHLLRYWDAATGQDRPVATFDADWTAGLSASPDGQSVIYGRSVFGWDLMMIENFR